MGLFDLFRGPDINAGVREFESTSDSVLLDVRSKDEYDSGHIAGADNIPLDEIDRAAKLYAGKDTPLFVYCASGSRSAQAVAFLSRAGVGEVKNIGGIMGWKGQVVRG